MVRLHVAGDRRRVRFPGGVRMNYRVHGLVVASPTALPLPEIGDESVDVAYRVGLESGSASRAELQQRR